ncbi:hypothetical protein CEP53_015002 [Fusarium sp. AF-6]|nr:hypothetical protein CEP53_015002 [Fusarium sp. AF-6]
MNEFHSTGADAFSPQNQRDRTGSMSVGNAPVSPPGPPSDHGGAAVDDVSQSPDGDAAPGLSGASPEVLKQVSEVLSSDIGVVTLLNRLKQSIASAKEFALFLKKRSSLEEDHANSLKKLTRTTQEVMRRPDHRQGTFAGAYDAMASTHDRMAENGIEFANELHRMHDELIELANHAERSRKTWKANGLSAENKVSEMEQTMRKSKTKYDSLADDYEKAKMGEARQSGKMFGALKGHKSAAQHEEDLLKKVQAADQTYKGHVQALQTEKAQLVASTRPEAVKALQESIIEIDAGVAMQMQKFASFNEKLLLSNGLSVSPIQGPGQSTTSQRSLRQAASSIDNEKDLNDYVVAQVRSMPANTGEIKYERNPVLNPPGSNHQPGGPVQQPAVTQPQSQSSFPIQPLGPGSRTSTLGLGPITGVTGDGPFSPTDDPRPFSQPHNRSFSQGNVPTPQAGPGPGPVPQFTGRGPSQPAPGQQRYGNGGSISSAGPPQLGALPFQPNASPPQQSGPYQAPHDRKGSGVGLGQQGAPAGRSPPPYGVPGHPAPGGGASALSKPMFGLPLSRLYERDGLAVPMVVYQCIQAVDLYGLNVEGIYRQSGSMAHIQKLKNMFDTGMSRRLGSENRADHEVESSSPALDFRNPENFYHDVNSVTGLLKQFFRDLPDPLLTLEHHDSFIAAAKHDDDTVRRDSLHAIINSLPDPNYATLRALTLHLWRIMDNCHNNRMNSHNLAVIFGPTLMGTDPSTAIADAGWQIKAIDTILQNTMQIFDED